MAVAWLARAQTPAASPIPNLVTFTDIGHAQPEPVLFDPVADVYVISNLNGVPLATDDNGFITRLRPDGEAIAARWIDDASDAVTLHAPKGMAIFGDTLYVADIDVVRLFDRRTGEPIGEIGVPDATFRNDVAAGPDGVIYVSDTDFALGAAGETTMASNGAVYTIVEGMAERFAAGNDLTTPNGLIVDRNSDVYVVTMGDPGAVLAIQPDGTHRDVASIPGGMLDGVVILLDNALAISS